MILAVRPEVQELVLAQTMQPLMSLVRLMDNPQLVRGSDVDQKEVIANGLKILRFLTAERDYAI